MKTSLGLIILMILLLRANTMLFKVRKFVNIKVLKSIYYTIFDCHLNYANTVLGQNRYSINRLIILQKKLSILWVLNAEMPILNFNLPSSFSHWFSFSSDSHNYETSSSSVGLLKVKTVKTKKYGKEAMVNNAIFSWNNQKNILSRVLCGLSYSKLKSLLVKHFLKTYSNND